MGFPEVAPYSTAARFKFGGGGVGEVRHAADIKIGIAGRRGPFTALVLEGDIPASLPKGDLEAPGGQLDFERDILTIQKHGVDNPLSVNEMGHSALSVVAYSREPSCVDPGPNVAASYVKWTLLGKRPD